MATLLLSFVGTITALIAWGIARHYLPGYLSEKGKNLATKEDIADITRRIEEVKHTYATLLEEQKQTGQLRFAALDRRLEAAQQAFTLWWNLLRSLHTPQIDDEVNKCQEFWVANRLYLSDDISFYFRSAYMAALNHAYLKDAARKDPLQQSKVYENFDRIKEAGDQIVRSVAIPPLHQDVPISDELRKQA